MIEEGFKFLLEEVVGESVRGLLRGARSRRILRLRLAGWLCLLGSIAVAWIGTRSPPSIDHGIAIAIGTTAVFAAIAFGFAASILDARLGRTPGGPR